MLPRHRRFLGICMVLLTVGLASFFILKSFQDNLLYYLTPSEVIAGKAPEDREFRIGGLVLTGSFYRQTGSLTSQFILTDCTPKASIERFLSKNGFVKTNNFNFSLSFLEISLLS